MQLEVIARTPKGRARPTPLLFVHGAYGGAWEWDAGRSSRVPRSTWGGG